MTGKRKEAAGRRFVRFLPVVRSDSTRTSRRNDDKQGVIRVNIGSASMDVEPGFDDGTLRRVLVLMSELQRGQR